MRVSDMLAGARTRPITWLFPGVVLAAVVFGDAVVGLPNVCVYRALTDTPCAGCGLTRAFVAMAGGRWASAIELNPLSPLIFGLLAAWFGAVIWSWRTGRESLAPPRWRRWVLWGTIVAGLVLHVGRALRWLPWPP